MSDVTSVEDLFFTALEIGSDVERTKYLDSACGGDFDSRRQVEKMLRAHTRLGGFLKRPAIEQFEAPMELNDTIPWHDASTDGQNVEDSLEFLQPSDHPDSLGRLGHYEVLEVLGRGGFGIVFRAMDEQLQRAVAIKVLAPQLAATTIARKRFVAEARLCARIRHVNVIHVYAVAEKTPPYLVMEMIPGETLQQRLKRTGPLNVAEVARIGRQIAEGLAAAHSIGLIHRDVKPENILLESGSGDQTGSDFVKISDFGLARAANDTSITQSGIVAGTPMFMSPEQALGEALDHRTDLFSLGSVLYTMCCGHAPFRGNSTFAVLKRVVEESPQPIRDSFPETPRWLCEIITRLHARNPDDRFASAREVADVLDRHLAQIEHSANASAVSDAALAVKEPVVQERVAATPAIEGRVRQGRLAARRWAVASAMILVIFGSLGFTEATGLTNLHSVVIRLFSSEGTLVVEIDDPGVSVRIDGAEIVITGTGAREIRLRPGKYEVEARRDGKIVSRELVTVTNNGRRVVRVSQEAVVPKNAEVAGAEPDPRMLDAAAWESSVAVLPTSERVEAVVARLKELNPEFDGTYQDPHGFFDVWIADPELQDISPVRAMPGLQKLFFLSDRISDLSPLQGLKLTRLALSCSQISDLSPLHGMSLRHFDLSGSGNVTDLSPLKGMPMADLSIAYTRVEDLTPLIGMKLDVLNCDSSNITDLLPLTRIPLTTLMIHNTTVSDLSPLRGMSLIHLNCNNSEVNDASLTALSECSNLRILRLKGTKVTAAGIEQLKNVLPGCRIEWDGGVIEPQ